MPKMIKPAVAADETKKHSLTVPYGDGELTVKIPTYLPWYRLAGLQDFLSVGESTSERVVFGAAKMIEMAGPAGWDLTAGEGGWDSGAPDPADPAKKKILPEGSPIPLTEETFREMAEGDQAAAIALVAAFLAYMPELMEETRKRAEAASKSRGRNLPSLSHGRKARKPTRRQRSKPGPA